MSGRRLRSALVLTVIFLSGLCAGQEIAVAAAADLQSAMQEVVGQFQKQTGKTVKIIYGSSGNFFQQIPNGAPYTRLPITAR